MTLLALVLVSCGPHEPPVPAGIPDDPSAEDIFEAQIRGLGGAEAIRSKTAYYVRVSAVMRSPDISRTIEVWGQAPDRLLMRLAPPEGAVAWRGYSEGVGWRYEEDGAAWLEVGDDLDRMAFDADFYGELHYATRYPVAEVEGTGSFDGKPAWVMRVVTSSGEEQRRWYEHATGLKLGRTGTTHLSGVGDVLHVVHYSGYREIEGVMVNMRTREEVGPSVLVSDVEVFDWEPRDLPDFAPPPRIRELLDEGAAEPGAADESG